MNKFSLCIPTHNRFDTFLKINIPKFLHNPYISEIIIVDDATNDYHKLIEEYGSNKKIIIHSQKQRVGPFKNKVTACSYANNEWICLLDSDNFADLDYFEEVFKEWKINGVNEKIIYTPSNALPNFKLENEKHIPKYIDKELWNKEYKTKHLYGTWALNLGNCIFHKSLVTNLQDPIYNQIYPYVDALYINWIALNSGFSIKFLENMTYIHTIHDGSTYTNNAHLESHFCDTFDWYVYS
jgi:hypothetical protein